MAEYIEKNEAVSAMLREYESHEFPYYKEAYSRAAHILGSLPAAEVQPVVHGYWIEVDDGWDTYWKCSVCGDSWNLEEGTPEENRMKYCQNCGAKMDGESND